MLADLLSKFKFQPKYGEISSPHYYKVSGARLSSIMTIFGWWWVDHMVQLHWSWNYKIPHQFTTDQNYVGLEFLY